MHGLSKLFCKPGILNSGLKGATVHAKLTHIEFSNGYVEIPPIQLMIIMLKTVAGSITPFVMHGLSKLFRKPGILNSALEGATVHAKLTHDLYPRP